jgi:hypothetical protein
MNDTTRLEAIQQHQLGEVTGGNAGTGAFNRNPKPTGQPSQYGHLTVAPDTGFRTWVGAAGGTAFFGGWGGLIGGVAGFASGLGVTWGDKPASKPR